MSQELEQALLDAQARWKASGYGDGKDRSELLRAEGRLAAARGEPWAEPIDLGVQWDGGAPLPHVLANGHSVVVLCREAVVDPGWDGTRVQVVSASDAEPAPLLMFRFSQCYAERLGGPNDEAQHGHTLHGRGLGYYQPHVVHNSPWIAEAESINAVHPQHRTDWQRRLNHYLFTFHDETFEALAIDVSVERVHAPFLDQLLHCARDMASS